KGGAIQVFKSLNLPNEHLAKIYFYGKFPPRIWDAGDIEPDKWTLDYSGNVYFADPVTPQKASVLYDNHLYLDVKCQFARKTGRTESDIKTLLDKPMKLNATKKQLISKG